ncbi:MAG: MFS transporter, partial [Chloroflexota bacterium]
GHRGYPCFRPDSLPILLLSPYFGKFTDREGGFWAMTLGLLVAGICGALYVAVPEVWFVMLIGLIEGTAFAVAAPAMYLLVARASPPGRSSTAQGLFGAAGTAGTIIASLAAGAMAAIDLRLPYYLTSVGILGCLAIGLTVGRRGLYDAMQPTHRPLSVAMATDAAAGEGVP